MHSAARIPDIANIVFINILSNVKLALIPLWSLYMHSKTFDIFFKFFNQLGIDNELVWLAESYLYIKKEDIERANVSLDKLLSSELISDKEKELIAETKEHLKNRESGKALNFLTDKVFMSRLGASYAYSYADEVEWVVFLKKSKEGREILAKFENFESSINKAKELLSLEEIKNKSKSFVGDLM